MYWENWPNSMKLYMITCRWTSTLCLISYLYFKWKYCNCKRDWIIITDTNKQMSPYKLLLIWLMLYVTVDDISVVYHYMWPHMDVWAVEEDVTNCLVPLPWTGGALLPAKPNTDTEKSIFTVLQRNRTPLLCNRVQTYNPYMRWKMCITMVPTDHITFFRSFEVHFEGVFKDFSLFFQTSIHEK